MKLHVIFCFIGLYILGVHISSLDATKGQNNRNPNGRNQNNRNPNGRNQNGRNPNGRNDHGGISFVKTFPDTVAIGSIISGTSRYVFIDLNGDQYAYKQELNPYCVQTVNNGLQRSITDQYKPLTRVQVESIKQMSPECISQVDSEQLL